MMSTGVDQAPPPKDFTLLNRYQYNHQYTPSGTVPGSLTHSTLGTPSGDHDVNYSRYMHL